MSLSLSLCISCQYQVGRTLLSILRHLFTCVVYFQLCGIYSITPQICETLRARARSHFDGFILLCFRFAYSIYSNLL